MVLCIRKNSQNSKREDGFLLAQEGQRRAGMTSKNTRLLPLLLQGQAYFVPRNDTRTFIYKGFRPPSGMPFKRT